MYPLKFENLYYEKIWGGKDFKKFRKDVPGEKIGESWDVACHPNGMSIVSNGKYKGMKLDQLIKLKGEDLLGTKFTKEQFPLLIKILNADEKLSVQVHPNDEYALANEGEMGKTEIWYIIDAEEGASIILGTKDCSKEEFEKAIENNRIEDYMNEIQVKKGEVYYIKTGLLHSLGPGIIVAEIQQSSDTTYRVHDYGRDRELHMEKALEVIDFNIEGKRSIGLCVKNDNYDKIYYCLNEYFALELYDIKTNLRRSGDKERFCIYTCVEGKGVIEYNNIKQELNLGDSMLIPAVLGEYEILGRLKLLKSYIPSIADVEKEILEVIS